MISKWLTIIRNLDGGSVRKCIPQKFIHKYKESINRYDSRPFEKKYMKRNTQTKFCVVRSGYSSRLDIVRAKKEENLVIRRRAKRVRCDQKKARMYQDVRKLIENEVRDRWLNGIPMTRPDIYRLLKQRYVSGEFYENFLAHHESRKNWQISFQEHLIILAFVSENLLCHRASQIIGKILP